MRKTRVIILSLALAVLAGIQLVTIFSKPKVVFKGDTSCLASKGDTSRPVTFSGELREVSPFVVEEIPDLALELLGTAIGNIKDPIAFIKDLETGKQGIYKLGYKIKEAKITRIAKGEVDLDVNGRKETLKLRTGSSDYANAASPAIISVDGDNIVMNRNGLLNEAANILETVKKVKIKPYSESKQVIGMKIDGLSQESLIAQAGIKDQDVVTSVNNQKIDSYQKALQVFAKAKSNPEIKVSLLRNGEIRNLNYRFDN